MLAMNISEVKYPKILVISEPFHQLTGTGITMCNLFKDWPKEKLALVSGENIFKNDFSFCNNLFFLKSKRYIEILYYFAKAKKAPNADRVLSSADFVNKENASANKSNMGKELALSLMNIIGITPIIKTPVFSNNFKKWFENYNPDLIYTCLDKYEYFDFLKKISIEYNKPLIVHLMDDLIKLMPPHGLLYFYWRWRMNKDFNYLLANAKSRLTICDYMSVIYKRRCGLDSVSFLNPIEKEIWLSTSKNDWSKSNPFRILYAGRLGFDNIALLHKLAKIVDEFNSSDCKIQLDLRISSLSNINEINKFKKYKHTKLLGYIHHDRIHEVLPQYDLLYLPLGFDKKTKDIYSVSMSTKIPEYMISGTPVLVNAPRETAYFDYANSHDWGYVLPSDKAEDIKYAVMELFNNGNLRETLGKNAKIISLKNHDAVTVRENFRKAIVKAIE